MFIVISYNAAFRAHYSAVSVISIYSHFSVIIWYSHTSIQHGTEKKSGPLCSLWT